MGPYRDQYWEALEVRFGLQPKTGGMSALGPGCVKTCLERDRPANPTYRGSWPRVSGSRRRAASCRISLEAGRAAMLPDHRGSALLCPAGSDAVCPAAGPAPLSPRRRVWRCALWPLLQWRSLALCVCRRTCGGHPDIIGHSRRDIPSFWPTAEVQGGTAEQPLCAITGSLRCRRRKPSTAWSLHHFPDGGGRHRQNPVPRGSAPD